MTERYLESSGMVDIDGVPHYGSEQNGVPVYRVCPPELVALILKNQQSSAIDEEELLSDDTGLAEQKERRHLPPKLVRGVAKIAVFGAVLGGAHVGLNIATSQTISFGHTQVSVGQALDNLWSDVTLPLRMAAGE